MPFLRCLKRIKQRRGHGVHSPFAYGLITNVICSPHLYYAFADIEKEISEKGLNSGFVSGINHLSFRMVNHFNAKNILEINSGKGVNTLFLTAPARDIRCTCVEKRADEIVVAKRLYGELNPKVDLVTTLPAGGKQCYDAIFINLEKESMPAIETLLSLSHQRTFWVLYPIKSSWSKQFWRNIVNDDRLTATFELKGSGVAFLSTAYNKVNYFV